MDKKISIQYFNQHADDWDEIPRSNEPERLQAMADRLHIDENAWVLDVGTGTGIFLPYLSAKIKAGGQIACVDFAIRMLLKAKEKRNSDHIFFTCAEIENVRFCGEMFDVAVCYSTFPHFHEKAKALQNIFRLLKPNGKLFICHTTSRENINHIHRGIPDFQDHLIPPCAEMKELVQNAGFVDIQIEERVDSYLAQARKLQP